MNLTRHVATAALMAGACCISAPSFAAACWAPNRQPARTGTNEALNQPRFARLIAAMDRAEAFLREDARLAGISDLRFQINRHVTYIDNDRPTYTASVTLTMHEPKVWAGSSGCGLDQGQADYHNNKGIKITFNHVEDLLNAASVDMESGPQPAAAIQLDVMGPLLEKGVIRTLGEGQRSYLADGSSVLLPMTVGTHLSNWEARLHQLSAEGAGEFAQPQLDALKRHRAGLSAAQLQTQVRLGISDSQDIWAYFTEGGAAPMFTIAPQVIAKATDKTAVRLVTVSWFAREEDPMALVLEDWLESLDANRIRNLISGGSQ